jgi:U3 small nucleolar RNA-associated protein 16
MIQSLPILLPDEILNAEPSIRPPTPPPENSRHMAKPTSRKLRFLDEVQKPPKDARIGNTSIKVLDEMSHYNSRTGANPSLAPKSSKASKNVRDSWLLGNRNKDVSNGLRRTTGGSSGFVRK